MTTNSVALHRFVETRNAPEFSRSRNTNAAPIRVTGRLASRRTSASANPTPTFRAKPLSPFQLCAALIETHRTHSQLLHELERVRELRRRGLVYREGIHDNRQFIEAYLAHQQEKINRTLHQLDANQKRASSLIAQANAIHADKPAEAAPTASDRFSSRIRHRFHRSPSFPTESEWVHSQVVSN